MEEQPKPPPRGRVPKRVRTNGELADLARRVGADWHPGDDLDISVSGGGQPRPNHRLPAFGSARCGRGQAVFPQGAHPAGKRRLFATFRWSRVIARLMGATRTMGERRNGRGLIRAVSVAARSRPISLDGLRGCPPEFCRWPWLWQLVPQSFDAMPLIGRDIAGQR